MGVNTVSLSYNKCGVVPGVLAEPIPNTVSLSYNKCGVVAGVFAEPIPNLIYDSKSEYCTRREN